MSKYFHHLKRFIILLTLVFCFSKPAVGKDLCLRLPLSNYARISYAEYLSKGYEADPVTETILLTDNNAVEFLLKTKIFEYQITICNLEDKPITMKLGEQTLILDKIGAIAIKPGASLGFKEIQGQVIVIITKKPDAVNDWYKTYNMENFPGLFAEKGYNNSGVISSEGWAKKGVVVINRAGRIHQWTNQPELEWLIDSMVFGSNLPGISMVQFDNNTTGN
jgi:hypothetical protein